LIGSLLTTTASAALLEGIQPERLRLYGSVATAVGVVSEFAGIWMIAKGFSGDGASTKPSCGKEPWSIPLGAIGSGLVGAGAVLFVGGLVFGFMF